MLSIVIVNYNTSGLLRNCLASLAKHAAQAEVIVVDNASQDGSPALVRADFPRVKLVELPVNLGFAGGNNAGLRLTSGDPIVLLNSDTVLEDDSLDRCVRWLRVHPSVGAVTPKLIGADGIMQECVHAFPCWRDELGLAIRRPLPRAISEGITDGWLAGTALMIRRSALESIGGGLDAHYFMYWEDADLSIRLRQAGWKLAVVPEGHVIHYGGGSGGGADGARRADLHAWYVYGKYRWFAKHRGLFESMGLWGLDAINVLRMLARALRHPSRPGVRSHAQVVAAGLWRWLWRLTPPRPGITRSIGSNH